MIVNNIQEKFKSLKEILRSLESVMIAFSGGVDSTFLTKAAFDVLGNKAIAVTVVSEVHPKWEIDEAIEIAKKMGIEHKIIESSISDVPEFSKNPVERCYYCKRAIFSRLKDMANELGIKYVIEGSNFDDTGDFRPGMRALEEMEIRSPLKEAGLLKSEIRELSRQIGLPTWDKPSFACLASRIPYGDEINETKLRAIADAEAFIMGLGISQFRVRHHDLIARIEVIDKDMKTIFDNKAQIVENFRKIGFTYVTLDLQGYRTGSMNEVL